MYHSKGEVKSSVMILPFLRIKPLSVRDQSTSDLCLVDVSHYLDSKELK